MWRHRGEVFQEVAPDNFVHLHLSDNADALGSKNVVVEVHRASDPKVGCVLNLIKHGKIRIVVASIFQYGVAEPTHDFSENA